MKDYFNFLLRQATLRVERRKSKLLLFMLLALFAGGVSPAWAQKGLPYDYGFEIALADEGWTKVDCASGSNNQTSTKRSGSSAFKFNYNTTPPQYLISPELTVSKLTNISFWYYAASNWYTETFKVGYSSTTNEVKNDGVFTWSEEFSTNSSSWKEYASTIPAGTKYIAIQYTANDQSALFIDDLSLFSCLKPTGLTTDNITSSSVDLSWTSEADAWNIQYKKTADAEWIDVVGNLISKSYTLSELNPATNYQVRVRTYCGAEDQSGWTEAVSFTTDCATIFSFPFSQDFNDITSGIPMCWDNAGGTTSTASYKWNYYATGHDGACVRFNSYNNSTNLTNMLKTPAMNFPSGKTMQLSFWWMNPAGGDFSIYISNDGGSTYTQSLKTGLIGQSSWKQEEIIIPAGFTENVVIVFKGTSNYANGDAYIYLDDVVVDETSGCIKPQDLDVGSIANTTAQISWTSDGDTWNLQYKKALDEDWTSVNGITTKPYTLTGLVAETAYQVRVQTDCGGSDQSEWTAAVDFTTKPAPITAFPFEENFDAIASGIPANWNNDEGTTTNSDYKWTYYATGHGDGSHCLRFNCYNNSSGNTNFLKTPAMNLPAGKTMQLIFWYKNPAGGDFSVYISKDGGETYTTSIATGLTGQSDWKEVLYTLPNEFQEQENVVIVFKGTSNYGNGDAYIYLDDVAVKEASADPVLTVSTDPIAFGMISSSSEAAAKQRVITIENTGAGQMTGVAVSYTATEGDANVVSFSPALTDGTINGNSSQNVTATIDTDKQGAFSGTINVAATGLTTAEIPVSGYVLDGTKICETFASKPDRWTSTGSWTYNATTGASFTSYGTAPTLTSPKIVVGENETLTISAKTAYAGSSYYVKIEGSSDNGSTWSAYSKELSTASDPALSTTDFTIVTLSDIPTTVNKLRITAYYGYINAFNGFTYDEDPQLALYSDEACTVAQTATATKNYGFVTEAQQQKYYIKNTGNGQIDLTIEQADGFTAAIDDDALTEGEKATLTIDMAATEGLHNGTVTVTAKNHKTNEVLGTFAVALNAAVAGEKNDINFVADALSELPAGWETTGWTVTNSSYVGVSGTAYDLTSQIYTVSEGETLLIEAKTTNLSWYTPELSYSYKVGDGEWSATTEMSGFANDYKVFPITGIPEGQVRVKFTGKYIQIRRIYGFETASVPVMVFTATNKNFGMVTAAVTSDAYTITNSGAGVLNGLSVTCENDNFEIAVADNATSVAANGGTATFTVKLKNDNKGLHEGTVTVAGTGVDSKSFTVKGYVTDNTKIFTTFTALPDRWTNTGNYWSFSENGATATSSSSKLETPKIKVTEGEKLAISAMQRYSGSSYYVTINGSSDNGATWTAYTKTLNNTQLNNTDYTVVELDDIPTTVNKLQLVGYYVYVNGLNGFTYDDNDPQFGVFSDAQFASEITTGTATNAWGFINEDKTATYYVKNTGTGTMTLSKTDAPAGFTATLGATSLGAGESTTLTISMANNAENNEGYHSGDVMLTAKDNADNVLGTFTVTSSGVVVGSKTDINFTTLSAFPAGWEADGWSVTANTKATTSSSNKTLTTGTYAVTAGEKLVIEGRGNSSWSSPTLTYQYSVDGGAWTNGTSSLSYSYSSTDYKIQVVDDIPAGNVVIKFTGSYMDIQRIYGFTAVAKPVMTLSPAATSYDFGMQTEAKDYVITVTNSGTAAMENMTAALSGTDAASYNVSLSVSDGSTAIITDGKANIPVGQTIKVTATLKASTEYKTHNATLTISADGLAGKEITLTGKTRDASKWYVDFASEFPASFVEIDDWTISSGSARTTSSEENSLTTQPIDLAANEKIYFDAYNPYSGSLKVRYSLNGGLSWSDYTDYTASINTSGSFSSHEIDLGNDDAVTAVIEFTGRYYIQVDNIYGGTLNNTAPMMKVTKGAAIVKNGGTEEFGQILEESTATYTITNPGYGTLTITSPIATTGVATASVDKPSLTNGEKATLTITMPVEAPYGAKEGAVTVATSLGDFVINYTATTMDPDALNVDFSDGTLPAAWYNDGWTVDYQEKVIYRSNRSSDTYFMTQKLEVTGENDVLVFDAKKYSSTYASSAVLKVSYSTDRVHWTEVGDYASEMTTAFQTFEVKGLAAGEYYLKFTGRYATVDNIKGWKKVAGIEHDLYVTATSIPTTLSASYTATATVTSLIAAEEGVYAKLFFGDTEVATSESASVALNGTTTFTMTTENAPTEEDYYAAKIVVYYSDVTVAFVTATAHVGTFTLDDEQDFTPDMAGNVAVVKVNRSFNAGWGTVVLPFNVTAGTVEEKFGEGTKLYVLSSYDSQTGELVFTKDYYGRIVAGKPYLINLPAAIAQGDLTFEDVTITTDNNDQTDVDGAAFKGNYDASMSMAGKYGVTPAGKMAKGGANSTMKAFRSYVELPDGAAPARLVVYDETTGISRVLSTEEVENMNIFNLKGQHVGQSAKGVLIIGGKKVIKK